MNKNQITEEARGLSRRGAAGIAHGARGVLVAVAVGGLCLALARLFPIISPLLLAILLGVAWRNTFGVPSVLAAGITFSAKKLLRTGIVLLGLQIAVGEVIGLGWGMILVVVAVVGIGMVGTYALGRAFGLSPSQSMLIAAGFSICGAAAVAGAEGVLKAKEEEVVTALAMVVLFGTLMIPVVPLASGLMGMDSYTAGLWAGASIHEVAQVVAVGGILGGTALSVAVVVKLCRVLMLAPVMAVLSMRQRRVGAPGSTPPLVPFFVVAFLVAVVLRSSGFIPESVLGAAAAIQTVLLAAAMFALGCGVRFSVLRKVGIKPFAVGGLSTLLVAGVGLMGVLAVQP
jgi:uncharacterized integral membrane protein (TIGR00698 family)